jgi:hypothetical protein
MQSSLISIYHQSSVHTTTLQIVIMDTARGIMNFVDQAVQEYNNSDNRNTLTNLGGTSFGLQQISHIFATNVIILLLRDVLTSINNFC